MAVFGHKSEKLKFSSFLVISSPFFEYGDEIESLNARCDMLDPRCMVMGMQRWENDLFVYVHMGLLNQRRYFSKKSA